MRAHHTPPFPLLDDTRRTPGTCSLKEDIVRACTFCPRTEMSAMWQGITAQGAEFLHRGLRSARGLLRLRHSEGRGQPTAVRAPGRQHVALPRAAAAGR